MQLEALEQRQLLFTITIGPADVNPATGVGTHMVDFGYAVPTIGQPTPMTVGQIPTPAAPTIVTENFDDEMDPWTMNSPALPPSGTRFMGSNIQIAYQTQSAGAIELVPRVPPGMRPQADNALRIALQSTDNVTFTFFDPMAQGANLTPLVVNTASIIVSANTRNTPSDNDAIKTDPNTGTKVELLSAGVVVRTISGAALAALGQSGGGFTQYTFTGVANGFDSIRFSSAADAPNNAMYSDIFALEDIIVTVPAQTSWVSDHSRGVRMSFTGPVGATLQVFDLYGRDMLQVPRLNATQMDPTAPGDRNRDNIPDFNDGIGRIVISGTNGSSSLTMLGYSVDNNGNPVFPAGPGALNSVLDMVNFGLAVDNQTGNGVGLPLVGMSLVLGSPFVRDNSSPAAYRMSPGTFDFNRADQGIFVNGATLGNVNVMGGVFGSSRVDGAVDRWSIGYQGGSLSVGGDLNNFTAQSESGAFWNPTNNTLVNTASRITIGRTVREFDVAGRNLSTVSVLADVNNPARAIIAQRNYSSREVLLPGNQNTTQWLLSDVLRDRSWNVDGMLQPVLFGNGNYRNDSILSAEFVGYNGTSVRISGTIGGTDVADGQFDSADVYAIPADATRELLISTANSNNIGYMRIVNHDGLVLAGTDQGGVGRGTGNDKTSILRFRPDHTDVYYLVINNRENFPNARNTIESYQVTVSGMAPVTLGAYRIGGGAFDANGMGLASVFSLSSGDMGAVRAGTGYYSSAGAEADLTTVALGPGFVRDWGGATINTPGTLYNALVVGNVYGTQLLVRGNLGTLITGGNLAGASTTTSADIRIGGSISLIDVRGSVGVNPQVGHTSVNIASGTVPGSSGNIGRILVAGDMVGTDGAAITRITTPNASQIDQIRVGGNILGQSAPIISVGDGSDVRFVTFNTIPAPNSLNSFDTVAWGQTRQYVDDAGATITVSFTGPAPSDPANDQRVNSVAQIRLMPINGSRGAAIASIRAALFGGANLIITSTTPGVVSIGEITLNIAYPDAGNGASPPTPATAPSVFISGVAEVDVLNTVVAHDQMGQNIVDTISNTSPRGDMVYIDAFRLKHVIISGNLGRTQTTSVNTSLLGPFLGISATPQDVGGAIGYHHQPPTNSEFGNWDPAAGVFLPINNLPAGPGTLEDAGSPLDPFLDGVIVRNEDLESVVVNGTVGDVIVEQGHLLSVIANADGVTPQGSFQGIEGNIYAPAIGNIDIGDGLAGSGPSPFAAASIVADTAILHVFGGTRYSGVTISGIIETGGIGPAVTQIGTTTANPIQLAQPLFGIDRVELTNGRYDTAYIACLSLDSFWNTARVMENGLFFTGDINLVSGVRSDLFRTTVTATNVNAVTITGAVFDASVVDANNNIGTVTADAFSNSTRLGNAEEFYPNRISAVNNLTAIVTNGLAGDITDLAVSLRGSLLQQIAGRNIDRVDVAIINVTQSLRATQDIRSTSVTSGRLPNLQAGGNIRSTSLNIAGPVESVTAGNEITQLTLNSSGPDGRVDLVRSQGLMVANISSSGAIGTIQSVTSDVSGTIETRNDIRENNGGLTTLKAGRDLLVGLSILGDVGTVSATRNIGTFGQINPDLDIRGNLGSINAGGAIVNGQPTTGQIYSDLIVGQSITGTVTIGRVSMKPGNDLTSTSDILAFGRINAIVIDNDFNGNIISRSGGIGTITFNSGSFRPGHSIEVNNGDLTQLTLNGGDLLGNVLVDGNIGGIDVKVGPDGFKGQIGIASWRRNFNPVPGDPLRNELPPNVARTPGVDGVLIKAGGSIDHVVVQQGSFTESRIVAGTTLHIVNIALAARNDALTTGLNNAFVAGDRIDSVFVGQFVGGVAVLAGVVDLGADQSVGGTGADADTVKSGSIGTVTFGNSLSVNSVIGAGIVPDANGKYNTNTAQFATGRSSIDNVFTFGTINVYANAAGSLGFTSASVIRGPGLSASNPATLANNSTPTEVALIAGVPFNFTLPSLGSGVATLTGPGSVYYDPAQGRFRLFNTTTSSSLTISPTGNFLGGLKVLGNAKAALGSLSITGLLRGTSTVFVNGDLNTLTLADVDAAGSLFGAGGNINTITTGNFYAGTLTTRNLGVFRVNGDFGRPDVPSDAFADFLNVTTSVTVTGTIAGAISSDRSIPTLTAGSMSNGGVRAGLSIGTVVTGPVGDSRIVARNSITSITVNGDVNNSQFFAGVDLGHDADYGGTDRNADTLGDGSITTVKVNGNFKKSDIGAGVLPGPSGYLGNPDVRIASGRGSIGTVTITGTSVGSALNSQQYRVLSTGTIGTVTVGGLPFTGSNNFQVQTIAAVAVPVRVTDMFVTEASRVYTVNVIFNQPIDSSTLSGALSVVEIRNGGANSIGLAEGTDYTITYDKDHNTAKIVFSRLVTERNLPQTPGIPGPGVYQIILSAQVLRGSSQDSQLDGDGNGQPGDDFARNIIVGDAGDKITAGKPASNPNIDFYGPADLDLVLRKQANFGSVADTNTEFTLTGSIGDHPDSDPDTFRVGGDVDVYRITLRAGQILKLGQMSGTALSAARGIYDSTGTLVASNSGAGPTGGLPGSLAVRLPNNISLDAAATSEDQYLITQTGTYYLVVAGSLNGVDIADTNAINNTDPVPGAFGVYSFSIEVFDDGNTGFVGDTNSGTAGQLVTPPTPIVFAGVDGIFGTFDDLKTFSQGDWVFTLTPGAGGPNSSTSVVTGVNSQGWTITRTAAPNGTFGTPADRIFTSIKSSIGLPGASGVPEEVSPDVDIYAINNGMPLVAGTHIRATLRLTATGSNIGLSQELADLSVSGGVKLGQDLRGQAQFAIFEMPAGTGFNNAKLVAAPSDFLPIGGQPASTTTDGRNSYGYDSQGDFFMDFIVPGAQGVANPVPGAYAIYVQGAIRSDYTLEIVQQGLGSTTPTSQNVFLETNGGVIDWLEAGKGITTKLAPFNAGVVGFAGQIAGQPVNTYILNNLVASLNAIFTAANVNIVISTNPADFDRQSFSTVFLAGNVEPNAFFGNQTYGASQHVDLLNADKNDQAVVFIPALADLGFEPDNAGVDQFVSSLTGAVARRIGELVGLRFETDVGSTASPVPVMAADSVTQTPSTPGVFGFNDQVRNLAGLTDNATNTVFYLGTQNAGTLIRQDVIHR
jgi:hypothetical protein